MIGVTTIVRMHARALWRRRWYGVAIAWLLCLCGWGVVMYLPDQYEAKARIYVDTDSMLRPLLRGIAADTTILTQVDIMQRTLLSRPNLQKVSHMADLELAATTPTESEEILNNLRRHVVLTAEGRNLFSLSYIAQNRETAAKVVQALLSVFVENNLGNSRTDMASARKFIDNQLREYAVQLDEADKRVADFKAKNIGFLPGDNNYNTKLDLARQDLEKVSADLSENQHRREALVKQLASVPKYTESFISMPGEFGAGPPVAGADAGPDGGADATLRVSELEKKLRQLLENYTDEHPDVVRTKKLLEQAKDEATRQQSERARLTPDVPNVDPRARRNTVPNPVYEQLELQRVSLDSTIASLEARTDRAKAEVARWEKLAKSVPEVAAELTKLTRDYDVKKKAYEELLNRHESAKIGSDMEAQTQTVQFRIVDPPTASTLPVAPKRSLLLSVVLLAGIVAGGAFAFMLTQIDDSVMTARELKNLISVSVLGTISLVTNARHLRQRRASVVTFAAACLALVVAYVGVLSLQSLSATLT